MVSLLLPVEDGWTLSGNDLRRAGWRVGIIAQPDWKNPDSVKVMGRPRIACGITAGNMDSMVCIYTVGRRLRSDDMYSPGGRTAMRNASVFSFGVIFMRMRNVRYFAASNGITHCRMLKLLLRVVTKARQPLSLTTSAAPNG